MEQSSSVPSSQSIRSTNTILGLTLSTPGLVCMLFTLDESQTDDELMKLSGE